MCYGLGCKWEIGGIGERAGECKKPKSETCPEREDYEEKNGDRQQEPE